MIEMKLRKMEEDESDSGGENAKEEDNYSDANSVVKIGQRPSQHNLKSRSSAESQPRSQSRLRENLTKSIDLAKTITISSAAPTSTQKQPVRFAVADDNTPTSPEAQPVVKKLDDKPIKTLS